MGWINLSWAVRLLAKLKIKKIKFERFGLIAKVCSHKLKEVISLEWICMAAVPHFLLLQEN